jgi:hypothetical protein
MRRESMPYSTLTRLTRPAFPGHAPAFKALVGAHPVLEKPADILTRRLLDEAAEIAPAEATTGPGVESPAINCVEDVAAKERLQGTQDGEALAVDADIVGVEGLRSGERRRRVKRGVVLGADALEVAFDKGPVAGPAQPAGPHIFLVGANAQADHEPRVRERAADVAGHDVLAPVLVADLVSRDPAPPVELLVSFRRVEGLLAVDDDDPGGVGIAAHGLGGSRDDAKRRMGVDAEPASIKADDVRSRVEAGLGAGTPLLRKEGRQQHALRFPAFRHHARGQEYPEAGRHPRILVASGERVKTAARGHDPTLGRFDLDLEDIADGAALPPQMRVPAGKMDLAGADGGSRAETDVQRGPPAGKERSRQLKEQGRRRGQVHLRVETTQRPPAIGNLQVPGRVTGPFESQDGQRPTGRIGDGDRPGPLEGCGPGFDGDRGVEDVLRAGRVFRDPKPGRRRLIGEDGPSQDHAQPR